MRLSADLVMYVLKVTWGFCSLEWRLVVGSYVLSGL